MSASTNTSHFHIASLDGIRTVAILIVFVAHAGFTLINGSSGVTIFFFLSGYLITTLLRREGEKHGRISLRQFYLRRVLRIFPPMYLAIAIGVVVTATGFLIGGLTPGAVAGQALHLTNYQIIFAGREGLPAGMLAMWSLAVEEHFYLVFPLLYIALRRWVPDRRRQAAVIGAICLGILLWRVALVYLFDAPFDRLYLATDTRADSILFGCLMALAFNPVVDDYRLPERTWKFVVLPLAIVGFYATTEMLPQDVALSVGYTLQGLFLTPIFIAAVRYPTWGPFRILNWRPVAFVGVLSYSVYLLHRVVLLAFEQHTSFGFAGRFVGAGAVTLAASYVVYRVIERPAARLRKRLSPVSPPPAMDPQQPALTTA